MSKNSWNAAMFHDYSRVVNQVKRYKTKGESRVCTREAGVPEVCTRPVTVLDDLCCCSLFYRYLK